MEASGNLTTLTLVGPRAGVDLLGKRKYLASAEMNRKVLNTRYTERLPQRIGPLAFGQLEIMLEHFSHLQLILFSSQSHQVNDGMTNHLSITAFSIIHSFIHSSMHSLHSLS